MNVADYRLALPHDNWSRPIFEDFGTSAAIDGKDERSIEAALQKIFGAVYEAAGETRR